MAAFSYDFILEEHSTADEETMAILAEHYSAVMPKNHSDNITDFFTTIGNNCVYATRKVPY